MELCFAFGSGKECHESWQDPDLAAALEGKCNVKRFEWEHLARWKFYTFGVCVTLVLQSSSYPFILIWVQLQKEGRAFTKILRLEWAAGLHHGFLVNTFMLIWDLQDHPEVRLPLHQHSDAPGRESLAVPCGESIHLLICLPGLRAQSRESLAGPLHWSRASDCLSEAAAWPTAEAADLLPRITFQLRDSRRRVILFQEQKFRHFDTLLPSKDGKTLYVGARDVLLAFAIDAAGSLKLRDKILWKPTSSKTEECVFKKNGVETDCFNFIRVLVQLNETHLYACGTYAFSPTCTYDLDTFKLVKNEKGSPLMREGRGVSPFDPQHQSPAVVVDGELYAGTMSNFLGNEPVITRTLGSRPSLKTDNFLNWLHSDVRFVAAFDIQNPLDNEKVYFFFSESTKDFDLFEKVTVSRVARVCKNDVGGDKVLQKKWTTFLKARLSCSQPGQFPHTVVQHVFALPQAGGGDTVFYGVFASQWEAGTFGSSAVCAFSLNAIKHAFEGNYKEYNTDCSRLMTYRGPTLNPHPGSCSVGSAADKILLFVKEHPLVDETVLPMHNRPLLVKEEVKYTRIAVHQTSSAAGTPYRVLFLGTDRGVLHKAVVVSSGVHIIEAIPLFEQPEPVLNLLLSPKKGVLYAGYSQGVLLVPMANCSLHTTCASCVLARDPYCAWDRGARRCQNVLNAIANVADLLQDIETGNPNALCQLVRGRAGSSFRPSNGSDGSLEKSSVQWILEALTPVLNSVVRLTCPQTSALANYSWTYPKSTSASRLVMEDKKDLVVVVQRATLGTYECQARENGYLQTVARYRVLSPHFPDFGSNFGLAEAGQTVREGEQRSYWVQFVTVTVLLSMTLAVVAALAAFSYHGKLKSKGRGPGRGSPEARKAAGQEKFPLSGSQSPPQSSGGRQGQGARPEAAESAKACLVQAEGAAQDTDADSGRPGSGLANRDAPSRGAVAAAEGV
ncbi:hypothetical protein lerEdw1_014699 [Lerista edwardsae]|nr:hypothetical protein lerEdw1_014699 [Lerista edwardsae]